MYTIVYIYIYLIVIIDVHKCLPLGILKETSILAGQERGEDHEQSTHKSQTKTIIDFTCGACVVLCILVTLNAIVCLL